MAESMLLRVRRAETSAAEEALSELRVTEAGRQQLAAEYAMLGEEFAETFLRLRQSWVRFESGHPTGTPAVLRTEFEGFLSLLDARLRLGQELLDVAPELSALGYDIGPPASALRETISSLAEFRARMASLWKWMGKPMPPLDEKTRAMIAASREAIARNEGEDVKDLLDRVATGGSLIKE